MNIIQKIYAYRVFDELLFIYPLYAVMFVDTGISAFQIAILLAVWSGTAFLMEVPSGVIADKFSRKYVLFWGQVIKALGLLTWIIFPNFLGFLVGFIFWGIESAFSSGTLEAFVYDELKQTKSENLYSKVIGKIQSLGLVSQVIASLGASAAILLGYPFVLAISIGSTMIAASIILLLPEAKRAESVQDKHYFTFLKVGLNHALRNPVVLSLIIFLSLDAALSGALDEFWTIYMKDVGLPNYSLGIIMAIWAGIGAIGSVIAHKFEGWSNKSFYIVFAVNGILLLLAGLVMSPVGVLFLFAFSFLFEIVGIVYQTKLQHIIPSENRATILSVKGFFVETGALAIYLIFGALAEHNSYQFAFLAFGVLIILIGIGYLLFSLISNQPSTNE